MVDPSSIFLWKWTTAKAATAHQMFTLIAPKFKKIKKIKDNNKNFKREKIR